MKSQTSDVDPKDKDKLAREWGREIARFRTPHLGRSTLELAVTVIPFVCIWAAAAVAIVNGYWIGLLLTIPAAGFLVRLFMLQHDCGHGSLFPHSGLNNWIGRAIGILTFAPYDYWRRSHAIHHATAGNLDSRGVGDIATLTVDEYMSLSTLRRAQYRAYRHPLVMFGLGPAWVFICQYRLPIGMMRGGSEPWISTIATNVGILVISGALIWLIGPVAFLAVQVPTLLLAATAGVWLFYVQHQFEETHWSEEEEWNFHSAAVHGSSFYDLPPILRWFTGNIGVHHVHHLSSKVPFYRLPDVLDAIPDLKQVGRITLRQSLGCVKLVLWDSRSKRLVSFREAFAQS